MKVKKLIEQSILFAIEKLSQDIRDGESCDYSEQDAKAIKVLSEAYDIIHRGKAGDY